MQLLSSHTLIIINVPEHSSLIASSQPVVDFSSGLTTYSTWPHLCAWDAAREAALVAAAE